MGFWDTFFPGPGVETPPPQVALGTSLPDTFASKAAAEQDVWSSKKSTEKLRPVSQKIGGS